MSETLHTSPRDAERASDSLVSAALAIGGAGLPVFPCRSRGKRPLTRHGFKDASIDSATISGWWRRWPFANIGIALPEWMIVVDLDSADAGEALKAQGWSLPATVAVRTARGSHHYYRFHDGVQSRCFKHPALPDVDFKGCGGYVLAPPSVHPSGHVYAWGGCGFDPEAVAPAPMWLADLLVDTRGTAHTGQAGGLDALVAAGAREGARNNSVARLLGHLFRRGVRTRVAVELVAAWNASRCLPPLAQSEFLRVAESIARAELARRAEVVG